MGSAPEEFAYFAGFFDGEGSVAIYKKKYVACLTNTDPRNLLRAKDLWGGEIYRQKKEGRKFAKRDIYRWCVYGKNSRKFLTDIRPYVRMKGEQIDCFFAALDVIPNGKGQRFSPGSREIVSANAAKMKSLKWAEYSYG